MAWIPLAVLGSVLVAGGLLLYGIALSRRLIGLEGTIEATWQAIEARLHERHAELPKLIDTAKVYMGHERELLRRLGEARGALDREGGVEGRWRADRQVHAALVRLFAVAESYPALKADAAYRELWARLLTVEEDIAELGLRFNAAVRQLNARQLRFPDRLMARALGRTRPRRLFAGHEEQPEASTP